MLSLKRLFLRFVFAVALCVTMPGYYGYAQGGVYLLQLGSFEDRDVAQSRWQELQGEYDDLSSLSLNIVEVALPPDNFLVYRTQAGPIGNRLQAESLCSQLNKNDDDCYVVETAMFAPAAVTNIAQNNVPSSPANSAEQERIAPILLQQSAQDPVSGALAAIENQDTPLLTKENPEEERGFFASLFDFGSEEDEPKNVSLTEETLVSTSAINVASAASDLPLPPSFIDVPKEEASRWIEVSSTPDNVPVGTLPQIDAQRQEQLLIQEQRSENSLRPVIPPAGADVRALNPEGTRLPPPPPPPRYAGGTVRSAPTPQALPTQQLSVASQARDVVESTQPTTAPSSFPFAIQASPAVSTDPGKVQQRVSDVPPAVDSPLKEAARNDNVEVAEAIRVPLSTGTLPKTIAPQSVNLGTVNVLPSQASVNKTLWAQVNYFADQGSALAQWDEFRQAHSDMPPLRVRITRPYNLPSTGQQRVSLRVGPFASVAQINQLCDAITSEGQRCQVVSDLGASVTANTPRYRGYEARRSGRFSRRGLATSSPEFSPIYYWLQLGTFPTKTQADMAWKSIQTNHPAVLENLNYQLVRPPLGSNARPVYRLRAGPFADAPSARNRCFSLSQQGRPCIVVSGK